MPVPPRESMGGKKTIQQQQSFDFHKVQYDYIESLESFIGSPDYQVLNQEAKDDINMEILNQNLAYDILRQRVEDF